jgi:hypothetical protein
MVSCPRPAWAFFAILFLFHRFARTFFQSVPVILWETWTMLELTYKKPIVQPRSYTLISKKSLASLTSDDE